MSMQSSEYTPRLAVIGGGAAGLLAAGTALQLGVSVTIFEHSRKPGLKVGITGKGRCNVTNRCTCEEFLEHINRNPRFLYSALDAFSPEDTVSLFESLGVALKTERGRRVFPVSDKAQDIVRALLKYAEGAEIKYEHVRQILTENGHVSGVLTRNRTYTFDAVVLATGGSSYPLTGSDGSGYALAEGVGHTCTPLHPSLVPLTSPAPYISAMQGLSLRNVTYTVKDKKGHVLYSDMGEMLFTHFGISGPLVLSASAHLTAPDFDTLTSEIDLKPALDEQTLDRRLLSDFSAYANKDLVNAFSALLPQKMIEPFLSVCGLGSHRKTNTLRKEERRLILHTLKHFPVPLDGTRPIEEAIVTSGGIAVKEVIPGTMESKICKYLYFAGELLDVDAYTGGYNLQIAFSTGYLAGKSAARALLARDDKPTETSERKNESC